MIKNFSVIESSGSFELFVFADASREVVTYHHGDYEQDHKRGRLALDIYAILDGDDPAENWDGNSSENDRQAIWNKVSEQIGQTDGPVVVFDETGFYLKKFDAAALSEFSRITKAA